ncbi:MAG: four helix bundle protein [Balneolaceae bacterium]|nr:four helix bundle protein [Balneolaceae bacterium]
MGDTQYDLEGRTFEFARDCRFLIRKLRKDPINVEDCRQLIRSSGSFGANYIEANEALSKKDFLYRIKICRKESKESEYWLRLLLSQNDDHFDELNILSNEADQLKRIFSSILSNSK